MGEPWKAAHSAVEPGMPALDQDKGEVYTGRGEGVEAGCLQCVWAGILAESGSPSGGWERRPPVCTPGDYGTLRPVEGAWVWNSWAR